MKLSKLLLAGVFASIGINNIYAQTVTTNVYCAKYDNSEWHWLEDSQYNQIPVVGYWSQIGNISFFNTSESEYLEINAKCQSKLSSEYDARPASSAFSGWYKFLVHRNGLLPYIPVTGAPEIIGFQAKRSDIRLKQDIQPLQDSLDKVSRIGGYSYSWRPDSIQGHLAGQIEYGVIAQQIQAELPELVKQGDQGYLRVNYRGLIPVFLESIKELNTRIEALEAQY